MKRAKYRGGRKDQSSAVLEVPGVSRGKHAQESIFFPSSIEVWLSQVSQSHNDGKKNPGLLTPNFPGYDIRLREKLVTSIVS